MSAYDAALAALYARTAGGTRLGLERTTALLAKMGNPHRRFRSLHVAGTNGKGSVVATLVAVLRSRGYSVGAYTSPHLIDFSERIVVDGEPIDQQRVVSYTEQWLDECDQLGATFFEATTALAFAHFAEREVDYAVVETGLGGRLDSTTVLTPIATAITSIGFDHGDLLGETLASIAEEKAGIFKAAVPAVIGEQDSGIASQLARHAAAVEARPIHRVWDEWRLGPVRVDGGGTSLELARGAVTGLLRTSLIGVHQAVNTVTALAMLHAVGELPAASEIGAALERVRLPGRFDRRGRVIFDVAHNAAGAAALAQTLELVAPEGPRVALLGVLADKDWDGMITALAPVIDAVVCTVAPSAPAERVWDPAAAARRAEALGLSARSLPDFDAALAASLSEPGTLVVAGSFHTVGDAMSRLGVDPMAA